MTQPPDLRTADSATLAKAILQQRESTWKALDSMNRNRWLGPCLATVNPPLWEIGHVGWFQERWCLRENATTEPSASRLPDADRLYHSTPIAHDTRWTLSLLEPDRVKAYLGDVLAGSLERLQGLSVGDPAMYFHRLALFHEMMHREAFCFSWQTHGYERPADFEPAKPMPVLRWLEIPGGICRLGSPTDSPFVFDNEKWATDNAVESFQISNRVISNGEFAEFVEAGGYGDASLWPADIWKQMQATGCILPRFWRRGANGYEVRFFDEWQPLQVDLPMTHVSLFEAEAWCQWAGCSLPSEAQWVHAAKEPGFEWGSVWEWTCSEFEPFPGFSEDPYAEYSAPWFHTHQVLKGASIATPNGMRDVRFRNYYEPDRGDIFNGFRVLRK